MSTPNPWIDRLDELKHRLQLRTEAQLAAELGVSAVVLAQARMGKQPLPLKGKVRLLDRLGYEMTRDIVLELLPEEVRNQIKEIDVRRPSVEPKRPRPKGAEGAGTSKMAKVSFLTHP